jgi:hypothetical protein
MRRQFVDATGRLCGKPLIGRLDLALDLVQLQEEFQRLLADSTPVIDPQRVELASGVGLMQISA